MKCNYFAAVMIAWLMVGSAVAAPFDPPVVPSDTAPYDVDHPGRANSLIDMRFLLDGPAGKYGCLSGKDGHFRFSNGQRFKCCPCRRQIGCC
ncbi:hypothetical protein ASE85_20600 [Sphingobium sp. Leaf26]|uniref:hypothetical protein n=1 Tax=Sphingobium sp. Leaf26 TaxID=1735693 RepID=UPI0006F84ED6|nr:hypothetical protein [Sphingobium sp. Leaf26]KQN05142.1 hypothetical protein ASE85_20600 [Sphingobium sp. Leaf26]